MFKLSFNLITKKTSELKGKREKEKAKSLEVSVWNCNADSKFSLIGQLTFNLDKLLQNKETKSWYNLSVVSDLSALSADRLDKLAEQARELDQFCSSLLFFIFIIFKIMLIFNHTQIIIKKFSVNINKNKW